MRNRAQKSKRAFRKSKRWKDFRRKMFITCGKVDKITGHRLKKGWQVHHRDLSEEHYEQLAPDNFLCCNNLTHKVIHWLWDHYREDPAIIDRLREEMEVMATINAP